MIEVVVAFVLFFLVVGKLREGHPRRLKRPPYTPRENDRLDFGEWFMLLGTIMIVYLIFTL